MQWLPSIYLIFKIQFQVHVNNELPLLSLSSLCFSVVDEQANIAIQVIIWYQLFVPRKNLAQSMSLHFKGHMEQKEWLLYMTRKVKRVTGCTVKLPKDFCIDNRFREVHSKMTKQSGITVTG